MINISHVSTFKVFYRVAISNRCVEFIPYICTRYGYWRCDTYPMFRIRVSSHEAPVSACPLAQRAAVARQCVSSVSRYLCLLSSLNNTPDSEHCHRCQNVHLRTQSSILMMVSAHCN